MNITHNWKPAHTSYGDMSKGYTCIDCGSLKTVWGTKFTIHEYQNTIHEYQKLSNKTTVSCKEFKLLRLLL